MGKCPESSRRDGSFIISISEDALILEKVVEQEWEEMKTICIFMDELQTMTSGQFQPEKENPPP